LLGGKSAQAGLLPVDNHGHRRIVQRLLDLHVAQIRDLAQLRFDHLGMLSSKFQLRTGDDDLDRRRRAEAHDLAHDVARLKPERDLRSTRCGLFRRQPLSLEHAREPGDNALG